MLCVNTNQTKAKNKFLRDKSDGLTKKQVVSMNKKSISKYTRLLDKQEVSKMYSQSLDDEKGGKGDEYKEGSVLNREDKVEQDIWSSVDINKLPEGVSVGLNGCNGKCKPSYSETYDAYYCKTCKKWLEEKCTDKNCEFCASRPYRPSGEEI